MTLVPIDAAAIGMFVAFLLGALTATLGHETKERSGESERS